MDPRDEAASARLHVRALRFGLRPTGATERAYRYEPARRPL